MKLFFLALGLAISVSLRAPAQVAVEVVLEQEQFLPSESMPVAVRIKNRSGQPLHLGAEANWLTFDVEGADGLIVLKNAEVPVVGEFELNSSQVATKRVDLAPYFGMTQPGRYHVTATVRVKAWGTEIASPVKNFDVITGARIWSQDFGMPPSDGATNRPPEVRKYTLQKANYLRAQLRLYVEVSDAAESHVFKVVNIGKTVSFSTPEIQLDRLSNLHVIWQSGATVGKKLETQRQQGLLTQGKARGRIDREAIKGCTIAEAAGALGHGVQPPRSRVIEFVAHIDRGALLTETAQREVGRADVLEGRPFADAVHHPARAAPGPRRPRAAAARSAQSTRARRAR